MMRQISFIILAILLSCNSSQENKKQIIKSLDEYISNLSTFKSLMEADDYEAIFNEMKNTNRIKEILK